MITAKRYVIVGHSDSLQGRDPSFDLEIIKQVNVIGNKPSPLKPTEIVNSILYFANLTKFFRG